ncbi:MAG: hypothetical protein J5666_06495 [Bacilli bacterium]|nr:hypothetical protein [Bacilli bacterium]
MNLSIKYGKGYYNVAIEKNHHQLFSKTVKDLNEIITNEVVEELLKNTAITLKVNHLLVLSISDQYPIIVKQEIRKFHQQKADELLGFHSPMFNVAFSKRHRGITINSFHLKEEVLSFCHQLALNIKRITLSSVPKSKDLYIKIDENEIVLWVSGKRSYLCDTDSSVTLIVKNLSKALDELHYFGKVWLDIDKQSEKCLTIGNQLKQRGDYEWLTI